MSGISSSKFPAILKKRKRCSNEERLKEQSRENGTQNKQVEKKFEEVKV